MALMRQVQFFGKSITRINAELTALNNLWHYEFVRYFRGWIMDIVGARWSEAIGKQHTYIYRITLSSQVQCVNSFGWKTCLKGVFKSSNFYMSWLLHTTASTIVLSRSFSLVHYLHTSGSFIPGSFRMAFDGGSRIQKATGDRRQSRYGWVVEKWSEWDGSGKNHPKTFNIIGSLFSVLSPPLFPVSVQTC